MNCIRRSWMKLFGITNSKLWFVQPKTKIVSLRCFLFLDEYYLDLER